MPGAPASYSDYHAEILRAPEDDEPRRALARFLHPSDPELASFITRQLAAAQRERRPNPPRLYELSAEERRLLARNAAEWTRLVAPYVRKNPDGSPACTFHRGLIAHVVVEPEVFIDEAAHLLVRAPIRHVDFAPLSPGVLPRLLASEALARLDSIGLPDAGLDDDAVAAIAACPHLADCLYLELSRNPLGPRAFEAIAASPHLRRLLVVQRAQERGLDPALTWHPGEVVTTEITAARSRATRQPIRPEGRALEARHGYLPWLHLANRVARLDARWFLQQGLVPVKPAGTPVPPPATPVPT